ncbi:MAG: phage tail protein, partial [Planctomycetaceae bacterium]|nr:phage tail protein [Planctomycetaceae bacterium]
MNTRLRRRRDFLRPLVEMLEPRRPLACEVMFENGALTVLGDDADNTIAVFLDSDGFHVTCDGEPSGPFTGVRSIQVFSGAGRHGTTFDAEQSLGASALKDANGGSLPEIVDFWGGAVDAFHVLASPAERLVLHGQGDADTFNIRFGRLFGAVRVEDDGLSGGDRLTLMGTQFAEKFELSGGGRDAWITKWEGPDLKGTGNEVAIESIEIAHEGIELVEVTTVAAGDKINVDNHDGSLNGIEYYISADGADLKYILFESAQTPLPSGGLFQAFGLHSAQFIGGLGRERFRVTWTTEREIVEINVTDIATGTPLASMVVDAQDIAIKAGDNDDVFDVTLGFAAALHLFGQGGNDGVLYAHIEVISDSGGPGSFHDFDGGDGDDEFQLAATTDAELIEILDVPSTPVEDRQIRVTDSASNLVRFQGIVVGTEQVSVESGGGDDVIEMALPTPPGVEFMLSGQQGDTRQSHRLYRLFSLIDTPDRALGLSQQGRIPARIEGGPDGFDEVQIVGTGLAERFEVGPGEVSQFEAQLSVLLAREIFVASIAGTGVETLTTKAGDGDDEFNIQPTSGVAQHHFGQEGDDSIAGDVTVPEPAGPKSGYNYDGGDGDDKFALTTTDTPELIEILGVRLQEQPDPLIRVTDLATNVLIAEWSIANTEAINFDSRGGNDQIVMRELTARLSDVDWTIETGLGNDIVDAQMDLLPDILHVDLDRGNDQADIRFVAGANFPPGPAREVPADIRVDAGSGVDSVVIDVFSSLLAPPPKDIVPQVTLVEVLTAIFVTGVGQLALLTLFPLGAVSMRQAIQNDRAGHAKTDAAIGINGPNLAIDLTTGATADSILVNLAPVPESSLDLHIDTGRENDRVQVEYKPVVGRESSLQIDTGAGNDEIRVTAAVDQAGPVVAPSAFHVEVDAGIGDDTITVAYSERVTVPNAPPAAVEFNLAPGGGIDQVIVDFEHGDAQAPIVIGALWNSISAEAQKSVSEQNARMTIAAAREASEARLYSTLVGSTGRDEIQLDALLARSTGDIEIDVDWDTGLGDDEVTVNLETAADHVIQKVRTDLGGGDDLLFYTSSADRDLDERRTTFHTSDVTVLGGLGDDEVTVNLETAADHVIQKVRVDLGAGDDLLFARERPDRPIESYGETGETDSETYDGDCVYLGGLGNDILDVNVEAAADLLDERLTIDSGGGDDQVNVTARTAGGNTDTSVNIDTGGGADAVKALMELVQPEVNPTPVPLLTLGSVVVTCGSGDDQVDLDFSGKVEQLQVDVMTGDGHDVVQLRSELTAPEIEQTVRIDTGAGHDRVAFNMPQPRRDGLADLIVGAGPSAGPHVKAFDGGTNAEAKSFLAYDPSFSGGVRVAAGDVNNDGVSDIITGAGP